MKHTWTERDDIKALYLYKYGTDNLSSAIKHIADSIGTSEASLRMRIANFKAIDTGSGLDNFARQSKNVFCKYKNFSRNELYERAFGDKR